jgi:hypothetical protein
MKLLSQRYKTYDGASKRAGFENGLARFEYERGYKARLYHYSIVLEDGAYRVKREHVIEDEVYRMRREQVGRS